MSTPELLFIRKGLVGKTCLAEERPFLPEDFSEHILRSEQVLREIVEDDNFEKVTDLATSPLLLSLCGENQNIDDPWVTKEHVRLSVLIIDRLKEDSQPFGDYLIRHEEILLKPCLRSLQACLEENWKDYPGSLAAFQWILGHIQYPHMGRYLHEFRPFMLRLTDDWQPLNKLKGVSMMSHLIRECAWNTELTLSFGPELIPKTLFPILHVKDASLIHASHEALILYYQKSRKPCLIAHELLPDLIHSIAINSEAYLRRAYSSHFPKIIFLSGAHVTPWFSKIIQLLSHCIPYPDPFNEATRLYLLKGLNTLMDIVEEHKLETLFGKYVRDVLEVLLRLAFELSKHSGDDGSLLGMTGNSLKRVLHIYPKETSLLCHGLQELNVNSAFNELMSTSLS